MAARVFLRVPSRLPFCRSFSRFESHSTSFLHHTPAGTPPFRRPTFHNCRGAGYWKRRHVENPSLYPIDLFCATLAASRTPLSFAACTNLKSNLHSPGKQQWNSPSRQQPFNPTYLPLTSPSLVKSGIRIQTLLLASRYSTL